MFQYSVVLSSWFSAIWNYFFRRFLPGFWIISKKIITRVLRGIHTEWWPILKSLCVIDWYGIWYDWYGKVNRAFECLHKMWCWSALIGESRNKNKIAHETFLFSKHCDLDLDMTAAFAFICHSTRCDFHLPTFFTLASFSFCCLSRSSLCSLSCSALCFSSHTRLNLEDKIRAFIIAWSLVIPFTI